METQKKKKTENKRRNKIKNELKIDKEEVLKQVSNKNSSF